MKQIRTPRLALAALALLGTLWATSSPALAQQTARVLSACGTASGYVAGTTNYQTIDTTGAGCGAAGAGGSTTTPQYVSEVPQAAALFTPGAIAGVSTLTVAGTKNLYTAYLTNTDTVAHYLWVVNSTTAPVNGTFTAGIATGNVQDCIAVATGTSGSIGGLPIPEPFSAQPYLANSTTGCGAASNTLTLSTVGFMHLLAK